MGNLRGVRGAHIPDPVRRRFSRCATATPPTCLTRTPFSSAASPSSCRSRSFCAPSPSLLRLLISLATGFAMEVAVAHAGPLLVRATRGKRHRSHLRPAARLLSLHASGMGNDCGMAADARGDGVRSRRALPHCRRRRARAGRALRRRRFPALARRFYRRRLLAFCVGHSRVRGPLRFALRAAHDLRRRDLYGRARHAHRHAVHQPWRWRWAR